MSLIKTLSDVLGTAERVSLTLERTKDGIAVLVIPALKEAPDNLPENEQQIRAALATPLRVTGPVDEIDAQLLDLLVAYSTERGYVAADLDALAQLREAGKKSQKALTKAKQSAPQAAVAASCGDGGCEESEATPAAEVGGTVPAPSSVITAKNPTSLI